MRMHFGMCGVDHQPLKIRLGDQGLEQLSPDAFVSPPAKASMCVFPVAVVCRQVTPGGTSAQNPKNGIDKQPVVFRHATPDTAASG